MNRKTYPSDVNDAEWLLIEPLLPARQHMGRPREVDLREIIQGIFYVLREGCSWRALQHDLPPWQTVNNYQDLRTNATCRGNPPVVAPLSLSTLATFRSMAKS